MVFYSFEMVLVGIILLGAMTIGGIKVWLNRTRHASLENTILKDGSEETLNSSKLEKPSPDTIKND